METPSSLCQTVLKKETNMGSSSKHIAPAKVNLSLTGLQNFSATCEVTNRIDIDKYFEHLKNECTKFEKPKTPKSPRRVLRKSVSSSKIEVDSKTYLSPRNKRSNEKKKRRSVGDASLLSNDNENNNRTGISSPRQTAGYFNYDISEGHIVESSKHGADLDCFVSRQKSWDLSLSKQRSNTYCFAEEVERDNPIDLTSSYSAGDFKKFLNNNKLMHSKSCDVLSDLGERHKEHAVNHGKIYSVSEQNRRLRRKYFHKDRKNSDEKNRIRLNNQQQFKDINLSEENDVEQLVGELHLHEK